MSDSPKKKLSTEPYKGVRDFYPEDMRVQNFMFETMRRVAESFGYAEYSASVLEPSELYEAKSGEEIVSEQTYTFTDRGDRSVTLRPEMTPTLARMVAARRREVPLPARWYSIPNLFRYERPQRGRLREHWQLNCDIFGVTDINADTEIIQLASGIMQAFGAEDSSYEIRLSHRELLNALCEKLGLDTETSHRLLKLIDRKQKISEAEFLTDAREIAGDKSQELMRALDATTLEAFVGSLPELADCPAVADLTAMLSNLAARGITNAAFSPTIVRGFDYYTGPVFELFDTAPENNRSLFGGGRYDGLVDLFGVEPLPAVGFGMGDVTMKDYLMTHNLLPALSSATQLYLCTASPAHFDAAQDLARTLREKGLSVGINLLDKKIGDQIKAADKQGIPFVLVMGDDELASGSFKLKHLGTGEERSVERGTIASELASFIG